VHRDCGPNAAIALVCCKTQNWGKPSQPALPTVAANNWHGWFLKFHAGLDPGGQDDWVRSRSKRALERDRLGGRHAPLGVI
jgi:hypothetical protein